MAESAEIQIVKLSEQMKYTDARLNELAREVHVGFAEIKARLDIMADDHQRINTSEKNIEKIFNQLGRNWVTNTISAGAGAILAVLVGASLGHLH